MPMAKVLWNESFKVIRTSVFLILSEPATFEEEVKYFSARIYSIRLAYLVYLEGSCTRNIHFSDEHLKVLCQCHDLSNIANTRVVCSLFRFVLIFSWILFIIHSSMLNLSGEIREFT